MKTNTTFQKKLATIMACATLATLGLATTSMAQNTELAITVKGIKGNKGNLMIGVGDLQNPQSMKGNMVKITSETVTTHIKEVPEGECTIYVYHDENENYMLDKDEQGMPKEGCAILKTIINEHHRSTEVTLYYGKGE